MSSDQMKKMLMLIESCSCESNKEELDEVGFMPPGAAKDYTASKTAEELAHVSDEALDNAYHYGRSNPGNSFGWQANVKSAEFAKKVIEAGETDIEKISDAIHKGWNVTAKAFVSNPDQFSDTEKLRTAGKLEAKLAQREKLMNIEYAQLPEDEKEKDRVVARALFKAIKGKELGQEASSPEGVEEDFDLDEFMESIRDMVGGQLEEAFRDANDREDYVNYHSQQRNIAGQKANQAAAFAAKGANNTVLSPEQKARRQSIATAQQHDYHKHGAMAANPDYDRNSGNAEPSYHSREASASRNNWHALTKQIGQAPRPQLPRESALAEYDAIKKPVGQKPKNPSPTASKTTPGQKLGQTTDIWDGKKTKGDWTQMEDAEFQSFMETLNYVMRKK